MEIVPVILCGGASRRLRGASGAPPKPFLPLLHPRLSLLQQTARRALMLAPAERVITITSQEQAALTHRQLMEVSPGLTAHLLAEPARRNTAAAVALALHHARKAFGREAALAVLPADHWISDDAVFAGQIREAARWFPLTRRWHAILSPGGERERNAPSPLGGEGWGEGCDLLLFGVSPESPSGDYGYIVARGGQDGLYAMERFIEKPDSVTARELMASGRAWWNSGIFLFSVAAGKTLFVEHAPELWDGVRRMEHYGNLPALPFDKAVVEKAERVLMQPARFGWGDVGTPERLEEARRKAA